MFPKLSWLALIVAVMVAVVSPAYASGPTDQVQSTVDAILEALRDQDLDKEVRRERIRSLITGSFDFRAMSQSTLATHWKKASATEQERFVDLFTRLLEASYMGKIEAYTNERVEYVGEKVKGKRALVETHIVTKSVEIPIDYKLVHKDEGWRVYDVVIEEVSLVRNYRSSYREIVNREGLDGLLTRMEQKINDLQTTPAVTPQG